MNFGAWIGFVSLLISVYVLWQVRQVILLLLTAVVLANALNVLVERFQRSKIRRGYAIALALTLLLVVLIGFFWLIVPPFLAQLQDLSALVPLGVERLTIWLNFLESRLPPQVLRALPDFGGLSAELPALAGQVLGGGLAVFSISLEVFLSLLLVLVLTLMLLSNPGPYRRGFIRLFPSFYRQRVDEILELCNQALRGWLVGILFNMGVITTLSFIGLLALKISLALAQALLAGLLTFINSSPS